MDTKKIIRVPIFDNGVYDHELTSFKVRLSFDPEYTRGTISPLHPIVDEGQTTPETRYEFYHK